MFQALGYKVQVTAASKDFGADLLLTKGGQKIVVQAKRHRKPVGISAVQEVSAATGHYQANEAWVVTNDEFTKSAQKLASSNQVRLINRYQLTDMTLKLHPDLVPIPKNFCGMYRLKRSFASVVEPKW